MKLSTIALDFDGTIAWNGALDPDVRAAIAEVRSQGVTVILVTGRILEDLRRVTGGLHFVDAVVAENGAVIHFAASGYTKAAGPPPHAMFLKELQREGISFEKGESIVDAHADTAPRILAIIRRLELPIALLFNRCRVMALPQAISKATGLREALTILRLSSHNAVAIGDAENDHELLQTCELGVAVEWGSEVLKSSAGFVLPGEGSPAVAGYIRALAKERQVPVPFKSARNLLLGYADDGRALSLAVRGRNLLVAGDPKTGKSWVTGLLCEQLILYGYSLCVLDPEGDYTSLGALPGVMVLGGPDPLPRPRDLLRAFRHADVSVVIDLSRVSHREKLDYLHSVLPALAILRRHTGLPHRIVVDEAHYFLDDPGAAELLDAKSGGYTLVTYRASKLGRDLLDASQAVIVTRESDPNEAGALYSLCRSCHGRIGESEWGRMFESLVLSEAVLLPLTDEAEGEVRRVRLAPRFTPHVRHQAKYLDLPVPEERAFVFWRSGSPDGHRARTLREFVALVEQAPSKAFDGHLRRRDFSRWIADVFGDYPLAKTVGQVEEQYCRDGGMGAAANLVQAVRSRYELIDPHLDSGKPSPPAA